MGFGQYATTQKRNRDKGYPVDTVDLKVGRMTMAEIMADVEGDSVVSQRKTAHNEVTRECSTGIIVCRLRETDIVLYHPKHNWVILNTGGWNTPTTRRHIMNFLRRKNFPISVWGDKKVGGNFVMGDIGGNKVEGVFKQRATIHADGSFISDLGV